MATRREVEQRKAEMRTALRSACQDGAYVQGQLLPPVRELAEQYGISLIYITHDLATAYQISDHIIVLNRGEVVEAGDPEQIVKHPQHDYTKLLIGSVPIADPSRGWGDELIGDSEAPKAQLSPAGDGRSLPERQ